MTTKKTLSRLGAGALATATVVAGLSFGPAATAAPIGHATTSSASTQAVAAPVVTKLVIYTDARGTKRTTAYGTAPRGADIHYGTAANGWSGNTVRVAADGTFVVSGSAYVPTAASSYRVFASLGGENSTTVDVTLAQAHDALPDVVVTRAIWYTDKNGVRRADVSGIGLPGSTIQYGRQGLSWETRQVTVESDGTFTVSGTSYVPTATQAFQMRNNLNGQTSDVKLVSLSEMANQLPTPNWDHAWFATNANGSKSFVYDGAAIDGGAMQYGLVSTAFAANTVPVTDGRFTIGSGAYLPTATDPAKFRVSLNGQYSQNVEIKASDARTLAPVTGAVTFDSAVSERGTISGAAEPGATVSVVDADGTEVARATADSVGRWTSPLESPAKGGTQNYVATATLSGLYAGAADIRAAFGAAVTIETPRTDATVGTSDVRMTGQGSPNAELIVREAGKDTILETDTVHENGTWSLVVPRIPGGPVTLEVTQRGRGAVVTTDTVAVNTADDSVDLPWKVTAPESGTNHNGQLTFTGTGNAGELVTIHNTTFASADVTAVVGRDGHWSTSRFVGTGHYSFDVTQTNASGTVTGQTTGIEINKPTAVNLPWKVTAPTSGSNHNGQVTFSGTGNAGELVTIHNTTFASADVTAVVGRDGHWSTSRFVGTGHYSFDVTQTNASGTVTGQTTGIEINKPAESADRPFAVTKAPSGDVPTGGYRFEGTGKVGAIVTLTPTTGQAPVSTEVKSDGTWAVDKFIGLSRYVFTVEMTKGGDTESLPNIVVTGK